MNLDKRSIDDTVQKTKAMLAESKDISEGFRVLFSIILNILPLLLALIKLPKKVEEKRGDA
jgi:hypothetical protein